VIIELLRQRGLLTEDQGAQCVFLDAFKGRDDKPLPVIVQKSDGGYLYATTDLAALRYRVQTLDANRILVVVGTEQALHFQQVFAVGRAAGFANDDTRLEHISFGNMLGLDGKKFSTRAGGVMKLRDLLDEAEQRARQLVASKNPDMAEDEQREVARVVGLGALKYADLSKNRSSNYIFDWDQMLSFEGNTAPYLQYAYTRIRSLLRRGDVDPAQLQGQPELSEAAEVQLALRLARLEEVLQQAAADAMPSHLCTYLYDLASAYMSFYEQCPVLNAAPAVRDSRLLLCTRTMQTLQLGLKVLGIETVERM
jgi:arginyl-tRNA synthetase